MAEEYDVVGYILKKRETGGGGGCVGCLVMLILLSVIGSCLFGGKGKRVKEHVRPNVPENVSVNVPENVAENVPSPVIESETVERVSIRRPAPVVPRPIKCRACAGKGIKLIWSVCPTCNGHRKIVDQARTAENAMKAMARGMSHRRPPKPKIYQMACPSCKGRGKVSQQCVCPDCGGSRYVK